MQLYVFFLTIFGWLSGFSKVFFSSFFLKLSIISDAIIFSKPSGRMFLRFFEPQCKDVMFAVYFPSLVRFNFASEVKFLGQRALQNLPSRKSKLSQVLRHHGSHIDHYSLSRPTCSCVHLKTFYKKSWTRGLLAFAQPSVTSPWKPHRS